MSVAAKVLLVQAFGQAAEAYNGYVYTADIQRDCAAGFFAKKHFQVKPLNNAGALDELLAICNTYNIGLIVPTRDGELSFFSKHRTVFEDRGIHVLVSDLASLDVVSNKDIFSDFVERHNMKAIPRISGNRALKDADYPLFVRPKIGAGGIGACKVNSEAELPSNIDDFLVHPYLEAPEYSIDLLMDLDGKEALGAACRERIHVVAGESKITRIVDFPDVVEQSCKLGKLLSLRGHNVLQCFNHPELGILFIEINPRFGGASNLSIHAGLQSPTRILQMLHGETPSPVKIRKALTLFRYSQDVFKEIESS